VEKSLKFTDFQTKLKRDLKESGNRLSAGPAYEDPGQLPALILAYIGDAVFSLHVRTTMLSVEPNKVQILHTLLAQMASARLQALALFELENAGLGEMEQAVVRRGRNCQRSGAYGVLLLRSIVPARRWRPCWAICTYAGSRKG